MHFPTAEDKPHGISVKRLVVGKACIPANPADRFVYPGFRSQLRVYRKSCGGEIFHQILQRFQYQLLVFLFVFLEPSFAVMHPVLKKKIKRFFRKLLHTDSSCQPAFLLEGYSFAHILVNISLYYIFPAGLFLKSLCNVTYTVILRIKSLQKLPQLFPLIDFDSLGGKDLHFLKQTFIIDKQSLKTRFQRQIYFRP